MSVVRLPAPSWVMAYLLALLAGCPVLVNIIATFVRDGASFVFTTTCSIVAVVGMVLVVLFRGVSWGQGSTLKIFAITAAVFWAQFFVLALSFPSRAIEPQMALLPVYALLWIAIPLACVVLARHVIDTQQVLSAILVLMALYVLLTTLRFALGLGNYHAGRWNPGESLEAIRAGRYTAAAVFVFLATMTMPQAKKWQRVTAILGFGPAAFLLISANARGPWLALFAGLFVTAPGMARILAQRIRQDVRVALAAVMIGVAVVVGVASLLGSVESNFARLFDSTQDGGSAAGRGSLLYQYFDLFAYRPSGLLTGFGYGHELFYPHNLLLEIVSVGGLPMLFLFLGMFGLVLYRSAGHAWRGEGLTIIFVGLLVIGLVGAQFSGSLANELMPWLTAPLVLMRVEEIEQSVERDRQTAEVRP